MGLTAESHRYILSGLFLITGLLHFAKPAIFVRIIPEFIPHPLVIVYISGGAEILGAVGILFKETQAWAGWGLILLLIAVFPANITMTIQAVEKIGYASWYTIATILRLPLQFVLIYWVYWACLS